MLKLATLFMFLLIVSSLVLAYSKPVSVIYIDSNGVVHINATIYLTTGLNIIYLPAPPVIETVSISLNGQELPFLYNSSANALYVVAFTSGNCTINYVANVSIENNVFTLHLSNGYMYRLLLDPNIILLNVPRNISRYGYINRSILYIEFSDKQVISYIVKPPATVSTPITTQKTEMPQQFLSSAFLFIVIALAIVIALSLYIYFIRFRGGKGKELELLNEVDLAILRALEKRGGSALQSELQKDVAIPRTTLWRHVRKLEKLGYVRIEKVGLQNRVVLVKKLR